MRNIDPDSEENQRQTRENERYVGGLKLQAAAQQTAYFTFGQDHTHSFNGRTVDKDCVIKITSPDPRAVMFELFGRQWSMQYNTLPDMRYFPGGVVEI